MVSFLVGIAGGTASGKTTLARMVSERGGPERVAILELDRYYHSRSELLPTERATVNYDHPDALELDLLAQHLLTLKAGQSIVAPAYDFVTHCRDPHKASRIDPKPVIIVEGILIFVAPALREIFDRKIFVDAPEEVRFARRLERDTRQRGRMTDGVRQQWQSTVQPMHREFCEPGRAYADRIIDGQNSFEGVADSLWSEVWSAASTRAVNASR